jgi:hypothetical protein
MIKANTPISDEPPKLTTVIRIENTNSTTEYRIKNDKTVHVRTVRR